MDAYNTFFFIFCVFVFFLFLFRLQKCYGIIKDENYLNQGRETLNKTWISMNNACFIPLLALMMSSLMNYVFLFILFLRTKSSGYFCLNIKLLKMISFNRKTWIGIGFWLFLFVMFFNMANYFQTTRYALISSLFNTFTLIVMYYLTIGFLFPSYYRKGWRYFIISFIFICGLTILFCFIDINLIPDFDRVPHEKPPKFFHYTRYFISMGFTFFVGTSISLMEQTTRMKENEKLLTEEKLQTELKLLKAQINPHFIFNALNNIYSLSYMKSENAPDSVLKLSEMLRYVFYDCNKDRVPLSAEINYIENFNAFQQMKSEYTQNIRLKTRLDNDQIEIAPMLIVPFIENAFKYSRIEEIEDAYVNIEVVSMDNKIVFTIENSIPTSAKATPGSGMGIKNVGQRLNIIYPNRHSLEIQEEETLYTVKMSIKLD